MERVNVQDVDVSFKRIGTGRSMVMLPGTVGDTRIFDYLFNKLSTEYEIIALNHVNVSNIDDYLDILNGFIEKMKLEDIILFGTSVGGWIAQHYSSKYPSNIAQLVLSNTFHDNELLRSNNLRIFKISRYIPWFIFRWIFLKQTKEPLLQFENGRDLYEIIEENVITMGKSNLRNRLNWSLVERDSPNLSKVSKIVIIHTRDDNVIPGRIKEQMEEQFPNSKFRMMEKGGHFPYYLNQESYYQILKNYLISD